MKEEPNVYFIICSFPNCLLNGPATFKIELGLSAAKDRLIEKKQAFPISVQHEELI